MAEFKTTHPEGGASFVDAASEVAETPSKIPLEAIEPKDENESIVLRALRAYKLLLNMPNNHTWSAEETEASEWLNNEFKPFDHPEYQSAALNLLKNNKETLSIDDVKYFFQISGKSEKNCISMMNSLSIPQGFSNGEWLDVRRTLITRYLDEIPENEDDPYNSPRLSYKYLIRPEVYGYLRGEDVEFAIGGAIKGHGSQEAARPERAAYIRAVLKDSLTNLDGEQKVVDEIQQLNDKYSSGHRLRLIEPYKDDRGVHSGSLVVEKMPQGSLVPYRPERVVETINPKLPMIAAQFDVIKI